MFPGTLAAISNFRLRCVPGKYDGDGFRRDCVISDKLSSCFVKRYCYSEYVDGFSWLVRGYDQGGIGSGENVRK